MDCLLKDSGLLLCTRIVVARKMSDAEFHQKSIARAIGCSQAMVSKYLKSAPSQKYRSLWGEMEALSQNMVQLLREGVKEESALFFFCENFFDWKKRGLVCNLCSRDAFSLRVLERERERRSVLEDINRACGFISANREIGLLVPQVRMNIASSVRNPSSPSDVASIPGRLVFLGGKIFPVASPEFGISGHLANVLLKINGGNPDLRSVINARFGRDVARASSKAGFQIAYGDRDVRVLLADKGGFGKEPCLYIFASSALEAAKRALAIARNIPSKS